MGGRGTARTQVGIIGAGPAGLLLAQMLHLNGIESVVLEHRSRDYVLARVRAGMLEPGTVQTLIDYGAGERLQRDGVPHNRLQLRWSDRACSIPLVSDDGRTLVNYGQQRVVEDLIALREAQGLPLHFDAEVRRLDGLADAPEILYVEGGIERRLRCDVIAGCDGFWGVSRTHIPDAGSCSYLKEFPFAWFGVLAEVAPNQELLGFSHSARGLAVGSARSNGISRPYLQVSAEFRPESMTDDEVWDELDRRIPAGVDERFNRGLIIEKTVARLRGFVCEAMQHGRLLLAGDAAHIVPPTGAKGLNLAVSDVRVLAETIRRLLKDDDASMLANYSKICLKRVWPTVRFSCEMTEALHIFPEQTRFETSKQYSTLDTWTHTPHGQAYIRAEMLGRPFEV